jgi:GNAT superfamily N-acetyltransferase
VHVRDGGEHDVPAMIELALRRCPHFEPWILSGVFSGALDLDTAPVAYDGDRLVGFATSAHYKGSPDHQRSVLVLVDAAYAGRGLGHDLHDRCLDAHTDVVTDVRTRVFDGDEIAMAVALHWGYEPVQLSITSRVELEGVTEPDVPEGVTLEAVDDMTVDDQGALDELVAVSQTNPEAVNSHRMTREEMQHWIFPGERPVVSLARVDGEPAAFCLGIMSKTAPEGGLGFTGVDPRFRGRGLGRLVKQHVHRRAAELGVRVLVTDNEQNNHGIRRLNAELGYVPVYGVHRMRRTR